MKLWKKDLFWGGGEFPLSDIEGGETHRAPPEASPFYSLKRTGDSLLRFLSLKASKPESVRSGSLTIRIFREILLVTASNPEIYRKTSQDFLHDAFAILPLSLESPPSFFPSIAEVSAPEADEAGVAPRISLSPQYPGPLFLSVLVLLQVRPVLLCTFGW